MHKPFEVLEQWIKDGRLSVGAAEAPVLEAEPDDLSPVQVLPDLPDPDLFQFAMKDVKALGWSDVPLHHRPPLEIQPQDDELEALRALEEFMRKGNIRIEQTAEYIEGSVQPHGRLYLDDLRSGRFSVQAHLDLHGMNQQEARFALDEFLMESIRLGFSCVRVIHGRGRHSHKHHPVLKENIQRWLCHRRLGRHVIAYTSARVCDGGGGAVYVLLRK
jgi:DNA-nicking Smr family endonuclease